MRDVRIDSAGQLRCWHCGSAGFKSKRTLRSKALVGVGALVTKKKLKCEACGEYNDTGNAKPYTGPASQRLGKKYGTLTNLVAQQTPSPPRPDDEPTAAEWRPDPLGKHELRYWNGTKWTEHVSDGGVRSEDAAT